MTVPVPQPPMETTLTLVTRARGGDRAALEQIAGRYHAALTRFAHGRLPAHVRGMTDTNDLVQVAFMRLLGHLDSFEPTFKGSLLAYLCRTIVNEVRDQVRRAQRRPPCEPLPAGLPAPGPDPLQQAIRNETLHRYESALAALPAQQLRAFLMRREFDLSFREIAERIGCGSEEAARSLVRRAVQAMAERLLGREAP